MLTSKLWLFEILNFGILNENREKCFALKAYLKLSDFTFLLVQHLYKK